MANGKTGAGVLHAGDLRRKLTIQASTQTPDGFAGYTDTWATVLTTWGKVTAKTGGALLQLIAGQRLAQQAYDVVMRYPPSIAIVPGMRILDGVHTLVIANVTDVDERHRILHAVCTEAPAI